MKRPKQQKAVRQEQIRGMLEEMGSNVDADTAVDEAFRTGIYRWDESPQLARKQVRAEIEQVIRRMEGGSGAPAWIPADTGPHQYVLLDFASTIERARNVIRRGKQLIGSYKKAHASRNDMVSRAEEAPQVPVFQEGWVEIDRSYDEFDLGEQEDESKDE